MVWQENVAITGLPALTYGKTAGAQAAKCKVVHFEPPEWNLDV